MWRLDKENRLSWEVIGDKMLEDVLEQLVLYPLGVHAVWTLALYAKSLQQTIQDFPELDKDVHYSLATGRFKYGYQSTANKVVSILLVSPFFINYFFENDLMN